ncbi:(2R)-sulfolactate sulfo-lyase subunit beta [Neomoorella glycerini]|uniref:(2R)-sulfolactate sulfo-lyase subunit beta n=1 Tax=Neomoorella glycerini TaxID=55779 RepID=A0A6I5ZVF8_9FIRM|nr:UxaA family hydrolase [Moorella glycerini]QGP94043.1 (2R)-sulfolactate sulfo-lyase subunit beta [Moorella glycerini]
MGSFMGYVRPDGTVGARNYLLILSATIYANSVVERVANSLYGAIPITHPLGRSQTKSDLKMTFDILCGMGKNPNVGGVVVIVHFREELCNIHDIAHEISKTGKPVETVNIRAVGGAINAVAEATRKGMHIMRKLSTLTREKAEVSNFILGLNCGTSDTTSGLSSNVALGICSDRFIREGSRSILAELPELMGAEEWLASRAVSPEVVQKIYKAIQSYEERILATGEDIRGSQPTGDNIAGGISTIEEKSLGGAKKSGSAPIQDVIGYGERPGRVPGVYLMYTPGHGSESITGIAAAGAQVLVFSTGGGHTISHPIMPTIKITGNNTSYQLMQDTVDLDLSGILSGTMGIQEAADLIYNEVLEVLSGKMTKSEILKEMTGFAIHRIGISL